MSLLSRTKTTAGYLEKISSEPESTQKEKKLVVKQFTIFLNQKYHHAAEAFAHELHEIKKQRGEEEFTDTLYEILQAWINYCELISKLPFFERKLPWLEAFP